MIPNEVKKIFNEDLKLYPIQKKALEFGIAFSKKNYVILSPKGSGKSLLAEIIFLINTLVHKKRTYILSPFKSSINEKGKRITERYAHYCHSISLLGKEEPEGEFDVLLTTPEKCDQLLRNKLLDITSVRTIIIDDIQLLNDEQRGPILELLLTSLREVKDLQIICTGIPLRNGHEIACWLDAVYVHDVWKPYVVEQATLVGNKINIYRQ